MLDYNPHVPILFIIFNRPDVTAIVFDAIKKAKPSRLYIAADGPRNDKEKKLCVQVRKIATEVTWDCSVKTLFRDTNLGCFNAVSSAISWFFEHEPEGIILEDDCLPSESFFGFCSTLLEKYRDDLRIAHIAGCNFQFGSQIGESSYYFSELYNIWGWASWRRVWKDYDANLILLDAFIKQNHISNMKSYLPYKDYWLSSFLDTRNGKIDTWDYQYMFSNIINHRIAIVPNTNLISNIGFGLDATHTKEVSEFANIPLGTLDDLTHPKIFIPEISADLNHLQRAIKINPVKKKGFFSRFWKSCKEKLKN